MRIVTMTSLAVLLAAGTAVAQDEAAVKLKMEAAAAARVPLEKATTGAPYSADTIVEGVQVLADGNRIVRKTTGRVYRDGQGRTRREEDGSNGRVSITIVDPVGGYSYALDPDTKTAWRTPTGDAAGIMLKLQAAEEKQKVEEKRNAEEQELRAMKLQAAGRAREGGAGAGAAPGDVVMLRTPGGEVATLYTVNPGSLEQKVIEGVAVVGRKITTTVPAGQIGNEQPLTITSEEWRSPELGVLVLTRHSDPRTGDSSYRLTDIVKAEPDPSLFMVPPDYTVKDTNVRRPLELSLRK